MGYRSDIRICTTMKGFKVLSDFVEKKVDDDYNLFKASDFGVYDIDEDVITFGWNDLKWYEGWYKDVDAIMAGLKELDKQQLPWTFDRIGEEAGDIERESSDVPCQDFDVYHPTIYTQFDNDEIDKTYQTLLEEIK